MLVSLILVLLSLVCLPDLTHAQSSIPTSSPKATFDCGVLGNANLIVSRDEALQTRFPGRLDSKLIGSSTCENNARAALEKKWAHEDEAEFQSIANRFCSATLGWKEYEPGTCSAGGPPPICVADHWHRSDPKAAMDGFLLQNREVADKRRSELVRETCRCYQVELQKATEAQQTTHAQDVQNGSNLPPWTGYAPTAIPCKNDTHCILPNSECVHGYCQIIGAPSNLDKATTPVTKFATDQAQQYALDRITDKAIEGIFKESSKAILAVLNSPYFKVGSSLLNPYSFMNDAPIGLHRVPYGDALSRVNSNTEQLKKVYEEMWRLQNQSGTYRGPSFIEEDLARLKSEIRTDMDKMAWALPGIMKEEEFGRDACYNAFVYQHAMITNKAMGVLALPDKLP